MKAYFKYGGFFMTVEHALIIREKENVSFWEQFSFYALKRSKKIEEKTVLLQNISFHVVFVPKPKNKRQKEHLAQVIKEYASFFQTQQIYFPKNWSFSENYKNYLSCAIQLFGREFLRKYAKMHRVVLSRANVLLLCDTPRQAEAILNQIYQEVSQPEIYCKHASEFSELVKNFSEDYGIFLRTRETISGMEKKNVLVFSVSEQKELVQQYQKEQFLPILNLSPVRFGYSEMYEDAVFSASEEMNVLARCCGEFNSSVLFFLGKCFGCLKNEKKQKNFVEKNQIKCIKILKND